MNGQVAESWKIDGVKKKNRKKYRRQIKGDWIVREYLVE